MTGGESGLSAADNIAAYKDEIASLITDSFYLIGASNPQGQGNCIWNFLERLTESSPVMCQPVAPKSGFDRRMNRQGAKTPMLSWLEPVNRSPLFLASWRFTVWPPPEPRIMRIPNAIALPPGSLSGQVYHV
jgi:hypothetical protein